MPHPLVSIVCLCYNHEKFIEEAIQSVINQTYPEIEIIVVDDASSDGSLGIIEELVKLSPQIKFIQLKKNVGNCSAFNIGFAHSKGEYIIDFATDDVLLPNRVEEGVDALQKVGKEYGVQFSDAELIDESGNMIGLHSDKYPHDKTPDGNIYIEVIRRYFICAPTMLVRRDVFEKLDGYDETLAYEDFDFWIRSARLFQYLYIPKALVRRRVVSNSMKSHQFKKGSKQLASTYLVCKKIKALNKTEYENKTLLGRIRYEILMCLRLYDFKLAANYIKLMLSIKR